MSLMSVCSNPGPLSWISIGLGFNLGACKWEATPMRWVNGQRDWTNARATEFLVCTLARLFFWWQIAFFNQHGCTTNAANTKYNSRAAQLYREKIKTLATQATRRHGTDVTSPSLLLVLFFISYQFYFHVCKHAREFHCSSRLQLWLDSQGPLSPSTPEPKQVDFFSLHSEVCSVGWFLVRCAFFLLR